MLLTAEEVAEILSVKVSWVHRYAREGKIPCVQMGRYHRFRKESVLEWIKAQEQPATQRATSRRRKES